MSDAVASYLAIFGAVVGVVRPAIVVAVLVGLWVALGRANVGQGARLSIWSTVAAVLIGWLALIWVAAASGAFQTGAGRASPLPIAFAMPVLIGLFALTRSRRIAAAVDAAPPQWLIGLQVYRVLGGNFLVLWAYGALPGVFAVPAGSGDVLVGLLALPAALYVAVGGAHSRAAAVSWNLLGIADLVVALTLGVLTSPGPAQLLALDQPNLLTSAYPTVMTPAFAVPLSLILHGVSLWQWRRRSRSQNWPAQSGVLSTGTVARKPGAPAKVTLSGEQLAALPAAE